MYVYSQSTGAMWNAAGGLLGVGYSGHGEGKNNPAMEQVEGVGPIPEGLYSIGPAIEGSHLGPLALPLIPAKDTRTFGRKGFFIHGDDIADPGCGSHGCICIFEPARKYINDGSEKLLYVQA